MAETLLHNIEEIDFILGNMFKENFNIEISDQNELLMGAKIGLHARDLVYICLEIERIFNICFNDECVEKYQLTSYAAIKQWISDLIIQRENFESIRQRSSSNF